MFLDYFRFPRFRTPIFHCWKKLVMNWSKKLLWYRNCRLRLNFSCAWLFRCFFTVLENNSCGWWILWTCRVWYVSVYFDVFWWVLMGFDVFLMVCFDLFWCVLMCFDVFWCGLLWFDVVWCSLMWFDVFWCVLMCFHVFSCVFMCFDVFWVRMLK